MIKPKQYLVPLVLVAFCLAVSAATAVRAAEIKRPFMLWNKRDIAQIRKTLETEPWAKAVYEKTLEETPRHEEDMFALFRIALYDDEELAEQQKAKLLGVVRSDVPLGGAQYFTVLRYDILYDRLTDAERAEIEKCFRRYIQNAVYKNAVFDNSIFNDSRNYSRYDAREYTRTNWLPNIIWPRKISANLMAAAIGDEALIRKVWSSYGSWQWYFDEYLCDTGFYSEEFSKMGSTPGAMLLYCRAVERLGLDELGFGYRGRQGATMRGHIESLLHLGYPRVDIGSSRPHYPMVTTGDLRQSGSSQGFQLPSVAFQHPLVMGYLRDGRGGMPRWVTHGAWAGERRGNSPQWDFPKTPKLLVPFWFEIGQQRWPEIGFDYFLAQMRPPDQKQYVPSLYFGLEPVDPTKAAPPPAPSAVWPQRGVVMLRADESPDYWESDAPAVAMRLASNYAHNVCDAFTLAGYYAFGRPIYINRQPCRSYAFGFSRSVLSHCGVMVDAEDPQFTDATTVRHGFYEPVKIVAARSSEVFDEVDQTRALFLTREYLFDWYRLASDRERSYLWLVHSLGEAELAAGWSKPRPLPDPLTEFKQGRSLTTDDDWSVTTRQTCSLDDKSQAELPDSWYKRNIGVRMTMLGVDGTTGYVANTPDREPRKGESQPDPNEVGGISVIVSRKAKTTAFAALHEPFRNKPVIQKVTRLAETDDAVAIKVLGQRGTAVDDRLLLRFADDVDQPTTVSADGEQFTFADHAFIRIGPKEVTAHGDLRAMRLRLPGKQSKLVLNGKAVSVEVEDGWMTLTEP